MSSAQAGQAETAQLLQRISGQVDVLSHLIASPYLEAQHQLQLSNLDSVCQLVAHALSEMSPTTSKYATAAYSEAFNWNQVLTGLLPGLVSLRHDALHAQWPVGSTKSFYVVVFRSRLNHDVNLERVSLLDSNSHEEATASGGLLKYWFGHPNADRENLATCIWRSEADAKAGGRGPWHKQARQAAPQIYEEISFTRLWLKLRRDDDSINWSFEDSRGND